MLYPLQAWSPGFYGRLVRVSSLAHLGGIAGFAGLIEVADSSDKGGGAAVV